MPCGCPWRAIPEVKLTPKQESFCQAYVKLGNASDAYRAAYNCVNSKPNTIHRAAYDLLQRPNVAARIAELNQQALERTAVTADAIVRRAWEIANEDKGDRVGALALLAKRHREFSEKAEVSGADGGPIVIERPTREL